MSAKPPRWLGTCDVDAIKQMSLSESGFERKTKRKRELLDERNLVVPLAELVALIASARGTDCGCPPFPVQTVLHIHFLQQWFKLSDTLMEEALYNTPMFREFAGQDVGEDHLPDVNTILRFRQLFEVNDLSLKIMATVNAMLTGKGLLLKQGSLDTMLIVAPSSTKNSSGERDPEIYQTKKGIQ